MSMKRNNWISKAVAGLLALILLFFLFSYQVQEGNYAVVYTFGEYHSSMDQPGIHFKLPYPIHSVRILPSRTRLFDTMGQEVFTKDKIGLVVTLTAGWRITDPHLFISKLQSVAAAEKRLMARVDSARNKALQGFTLHDLVNTDFDQQQKKWQTLESTILSMVKEDLQANAFGMDLTYLGIKNLAFAETVAEKVFEWMKKEREEASREFRAQGEAQAESIRAEADAKAQKIIAAARAKAEVLRGQGDAQAAEHYQVFQKNPEVANYLREIKTLRKILSNQKTTVVLDTRTAPFRLLESDASSRTAPARQQ